MINWYKFFVYTFKDYVDSRDKLKDISGIYCYCGLFGQGKTLSMVRDLKDLHDKGYNIYTNFNLAFQDGYLKHWKDILNVPENSVIAIDEISETFNNRAWAKMPRRIFGQIIQCRKKNIRICCTAQEYEEIDKSIRNKAKYIIDCSKFLRIITNRYYVRKEYGKKKRTSEFTNRFLIEDYFDQYYNTKELVSILGGMEEDL